MREAHDRTSYFSHLERNLPSKYSGPSYEKKSSRISVSLTKVRNVFFEKTPLEISLLKFGLVPGNACRHNRTARSATPENAYKGSVTTLRPNQQARCVQIISTL